MRRVDLPACADKIILQEAKLPSWRQPFCPRLVHPRQLAPKRLPKTCPRLFLFQKFHHQERPSQFPAVLPATENLRSANLPRAGNRGQPGSLRCKKGRIFLPVCLKEHSPPIRQRQPVRLVDVAPKNPFCLHNPGAIAKDCGNCLL